MALQHSPFGTLTTSAQMKLAVNSFRCYEHLRPINISSFKHLPRRIHGAHFNAEQRKLLSRSVSSSKEKSKDLCEDVFSLSMACSSAPIRWTMLSTAVIGAFGSGKSRVAVVGDSIAFALGLATTLALLGIAAAFAGKAYGQIGQGLPVAASFLAIVMGLNLLEVIELQLPSFFDNFDPRSAAASFPSSVQAYLAGLTFALAASPCSTPVLATLLGYVATSRDPVIGGSLLLTYTTGYVTPLLLAASFAGALQSILSFRKFSAWINPISGALLLGGGVYTFLDKLFPVTMAM